MFRRSHISIFVACCAIVVAGCSSKPEATSSTDSTTTTTSTPTPVTFPNLDGKTSSVEAAKAYISYNAIVKDRITRLDQLGDAEFATESKAVLSEASRLGKAISESGYRDLGTRIVSGTTDAYQALDKLDRGEGDVATARNTMRYLAAFVEGTQMQQAMVVTKDAKASDGSYALRVPSSWQPSTSADGTTFTSPDVPGASMRIKALPEDVQQIAATPNRIFVAAKIYRADVNGDHYYVRFTSNDRNYEIEAKAGPSGAHLPRLLGVIANFDLK